MAIEIKDMEELKRIKKLLTTLNNKTVRFPLTIYQHDKATAAFMDGCDRELLTTTEDGREAFRFSDREGAREAWAAEDSKNADEDAMRRLRVAAGIEEAAAG